MPGVTVHEAFPGSIGVMPGNPEIDKILKRNKSAGAGGVVLGPSGPGALPADLCGEGGKFGKVSSDYSTKRKWRKYGRSTATGRTRILFPCFIDGCGLLLVMFITHKGMEKSLEQQSKWVLLQL